MHPLVSIVMPSLNQVAFLPAAVHSVLSQSYSHLELVVVDGGSSDGTQAWLAKKQAQDARLRWVSEPDSGPADALNKALRLSRGTYMGWLNSDDVYTPGAVQRALEALLSHPAWLMVYGHGEHTDEAGRVLAPYPTLVPPAGLAEFAQGCFICQPTVFFRRSMPLLLGPLDASLKTAFDFDYWLRAFSAFPQRVGFVDAMQAQSRLHAGCITLRLRRTVMLEGMQLLARHLGHAPKAWFLTYVNQLLAMPAHERGVQDLQVHLNEALAQATPWLRLPELPGLKQELKDLLLKM
jgi:cellulose synthase/poly-beta-1,6-N-acetylglucosamine synthase-like glycosyltransferase